MSNIIPVTNNTIIPVATTFSNLEDSAYRQAKGLSKSMLTHFMKSPAHYQQSLLDKKEPTDAMHFGTAFHAAILLDEPSTAYAVKRKVDGRTKEGKEYNEHFAFQNAGKAIINEEQEICLKGCVESIRNHPFSADLLSGITEREFSVFGSKQDNVVEPVILKGRIDAYDAKRGYVIDYKTCEDASPNGFMKAIWNFGYAYQHVQYKWLIENAGLKCNAFYFVCVEKTPPYASAVYVIHPHSIDRAYERWNQSIFEFSQCQNSGIWPAYSATPVVIEL